MEQDGKEVRYMPVKRARSILSDVEKSNLSINTKIQIAMMIGYLNGLGEIGYVEADGTYI